MGRFGCDIVLVYLLILIAAIIAAPDDDYRRCVTAFDEIGEYYALVDVCRDAHVRQALAAADARDDAARGTLRNFYEVPAP